MPAQSIEEVKVDMVKFFGERVRKSKFFEDYARIGSFLSNPVQYGFALAKLEAKLQKKFLERVAVQYPHINVGMLNKNDNRYVQQQYMANALKKPRQSWSTDLVGAEKAVKQLKKLLTTVLVTNEAKHGFGAADIIVGFPANFNDLLKARKPFKDISAGHEHGEHSHRIHWFLVSQMTTLTNPVALIYEKLPGWFAKDPRQPTERNFYMWEFLVDRDGEPSNAAIIPFKTTEQKDFRAPSNLNRWLCSIEAIERYPWLNACLRHRWDKRAESNLLFYVARKVLGIHAVRMNDIDDDAFNKAQAIIANGILTRS